MLSRTKDAILYSFTWASHTHPEQAWRMSKGLRCQLCFSKLPRKEIHPKVRRTGGRASLTFVWEVAWKPECPTTHISSWHQGSLTKGSERVLGLHNLGTPQREGRREASQPWWPSFNLVYKLMWKGLPAKQQFGNEPHTIRFNLTIIYSFNNNNNRCKQNVTAFLCGWWRGMWNCTIFFTNATCVSVEFLLEYVFAQNCSLRVVLPRQFPTQIITSLQSWACWGILGFVFQNRNISQFCMTRSNCSAWGKSHCLPAWGFLLNAWGVLLYTLILSFNDVSYFVSFERRKLG